MNQQCFVLEFAHSIHGQVKRFHVTYRSLGYFACSLMLLGLIVFGLFSSYVQMSWKASHYNQLSADFDRLRTRYQDLQRVSSQHNEQIASLETLASEVSVAYGIDGPNQSAVVGRAVPTSSSLTPTVKASLEEYSFLRGANFSSIYHRYAYQWQSHSQPSLWPLNGVLRSSFGGRSDPFSGEGTFHTGIDLSAPKGTPVHVTADGVVVSSAWAGAYGKLVIVDHGNGLQTYYAHLSESVVVPGQAVTRGQVVALSGATGRATGPHVHYEVRLAGTPINPYKYLDKPASNTTQMALSHRNHNDLGL